MATRIGVTNSVEHLSVRVQIQEAILPSAWDTYVAVHAYSPQFYAEPQSPVQVNNGTTSLPDSTAPTRKHTNSSEVSEIARRMMMWSAKRPNATTKNESLGCSIPLVRTPMVMHSNSPFFGESYDIKLPSIICPSNIDPSPPSLDMGDIIQDNIRNSSASLLLSCWAAAPKGEGLIGESRIPLALIERGLFQNDSWVPLFLPEYEDSTYNVFNTMDCRGSHGSIGLTIEYVEPGRWPGQYGHAFVVNIIGVKDLPVQESGGPPAPYVVLHLLPDPESKSTVTTALGDQDFSYKFNATLALQVSERSNEQLLHVSVWNSHPNPADDNCIGQFCFPLWDIMPTDMIEGWFPLVSIPTGIDGKYVAPIEQRRQTRRESLKGARHSREARSAQYPVKSMIRNLHSPWSPCLLRSSTGKKSLRSPHRMVEVKQPGMSFCGHCGNVTWPGKRVLQCKTCRISCHPTCARYIANLCGILPILKINLKFSRLSVLPWPKYERFVEILEADNYAFVHEIQQERPARAASLVKIFTYTRSVIDFASVLVESEIQNAPDINTLFRGNSMATKVVDALMKSEGLDYLKKVLSLTIRDIIKQRIPCEVDPTRIDKSQDIQQNWNNLREIVARIVNTIFDSADVFPPCLAMVCNRLQRAAATRFPTSSDAKNIAVSGFVFLRFFAPAVLGPKLFGLWDDYVDVDTTRMLTLCAKALQTLANFATFGAKETYMIPMNTLLTASFDRMREFITRISLPVEKPATIALAAVSSFDAALECSKLLNYFQSCFPALMESVAEAPAKFDRLRELGNVIVSIESEKANQSGIPLSPSVLSRALITSCFRPGIPGTLVDNSRRDRFSRMDAGLSRFGEHSIKEEVRGVPAVIATSASVESIHAILVESADSQEFGSQSDLATVMESNTADHNRNEMRLYNSQSGQIEGKGKPKGAASDVRKSQQSVNAAEERGHRPTEAGRGNLGYSRSSEDFMAVPDILDLYCSSEKITEVFRSLHGRATETEEPRPSDEQTIFDELSQNLLSLDELVISGKGLSNPSIENVNDYSKLQKCGVCNSPIRTDDDSYNVQGVEVHASCCTCSVCGKSQDVDYCLWHQGRLVCLSDGEKIEAIANGLCAGCGLEIASGEPRMKAIGRFWHSSCFTCEGCGEDVSSGFMTINGKPYCAHDYAKLNGLLCGTCGELIVDQYVEVFSHKYHVQCKICNFCQSSLAGKEYFAIEDGVFCMEHVADLMTCRSCGYPINLDSPLVRALNASWHIEHFNCARCERSLAREDYFGIEGKPYCSKCYFNVI